eukprot:6017254-Amphidinium_carterae.1
MDGAAGECKQEGCIRTKISPDAQEVQWSALLVFPPMVPTSSLEAWTSEARKWTIHPCRSIR